MLFVSDYRLYFQFDPQTAPAGPYFEFPGASSAIPLGTDYNVNQAKIAIGSGGWIWAKGFLQGTQIKYGFVPEKHTDFIFCTVGEEWGFLGAMRRADALLPADIAADAHGRTAGGAFRTDLLLLRGGDSCFSIVLVNVGMTIGLMPVMGIPLPFMSYGGSSLMAFTILLFIAVRLDASTRQFFSITFTTLFIYPTDFV